MANYATREAMLAAFGPFAPLFEPLGGERFPYYVLLSMSSERAAVIVEAVRGACREPAAETHLLTLLRDVNWRAQIVGVVGAWFISPEPVLAQLWRAFDAGSWISPQHAALLSLRDSNFPEQARRRLANGCPTRDDPEYRVTSPAEHRSARGPAGPLLRSCKAVAALHALLQAEEGEDFAPANSEELQALISQDRDRGDRIALSWRKRFLEVIGEG